MNFFTNKALLKENENLKEQIAAFEQRNFDLRERLSKEQTKFRDKNAELSNEIEKLKIEKGKIENKLIKVKKENTILRKYYKLDEEPSEKLKIMVHIDLEINRLKEENLKLHLAANKQPPYITVPYYQQYPFPTL